MMDPGDYVYVESNNLDVTGNRTNRPTDIIRVAGDWPHCEFVRICTLTRHVKIYLTRKNLTKQTLYSVNKAKACDVSEEEAIVSLPSDGYLVKDYQALEAFDLLCMEKGVDQVKPQDFEDLYRMTKLKSTRQRGHRFQGHAALFRLILSLWPKEKSRILLETFFEYATQKLLPELGQDYHTQFYVNHPREASVTLPQLLYWLGCLSSADQQDAMISHLDRYTPGWRNHIRADWHNLDETPFAFKLTRNFSVRNYLIDEELAYVDNLPLERAAKLVIMSLYHDTRDEPVLPRTLEKVAQSGLRLDTYVKDYDKTIGEVIDSVRANNISRQQEGQWLKVFLLKDFKNTSQCSGDQATIPSI